VDRARAVQNHGVLNVDLACGALSLGLGWKSSACPSCERVSLVVADVGNWCRISQRSQPVETEANLPMVVLALPPVKRGFDAVFPDPAPAVRQPAKWLSITAIIDKLQPFLIGDQSISERMGTQPGRMPGPFETSPVIRMPAVVNFNFSPDMGRMTA
jgi:hypothetical protein